MERVTTQLYSYDLGLYHHGRYAIINWCRDTFGEPDEITLDGRWQHTRSIIHFKNKADRDWLLMRWS